MLNTIRWFLVPVVSVISGSLAMGLVHGVRQWLLGKWIITSGLILFYTTGAFILGWTSGGLFIAPEKSIKVQRAIASPLILVGIFWIYNTIMLLLGKSHPDHELLLSDTVSPVWQYVIHTAASVLVLYNVFTEKI